MDGQSLEHPKITDTVISAHGDVAVATALWIEGADPPVTYRCETNVWTRSVDKGWQLLERHAAWSDAGR
jgi:hypothetical protein